MGDDQNVKGEFNMEEYISIRYIIDGVYGVVEHIKDIRKSSFSDNFNEYTEAWQSKYDVPDVKFSVEIRNEKGETLFFQYDINGLPLYIGVDMGTYFKMAQLREMSQNKYSYTINSHNDYDKLLKDAIETIPNIIAEKFAKDLKFQGLKTY